MDLKRFKKIYVEITNACNLRCSYCFPGLRPRGFMPVGLFAEVIKKIRNHTNYIYLHVKGEPLLHPQLDEILDLFHENNKRVVIVTNGTLLADKVELLLAKPALRQINISLHCFSELHHYENKNDYTSAIIQFTKQILSKSDKTVSLRFWNFDKENQIQTNLQDNRDMLSQIEQEFAPGSGLLNLLTPGKGLRLHDRLYINADYEFTWPVLNNNSISSKGSCYGLRDQLAVLYDGTVVPCCLDAEGVINLGNIQDYEIQQIFDSSRAQIIYHGFLNAKRVEPLCQKCQFSKRNYAV